MSLLYFKSILSMATIGVTILAAWSILEITGKQQNDPGRKTAAFATTRGAREPLWDRGSREY